MWLCHQTMLNDRRYLINVEHRIVESPIDVGHLTAGNIGTQSVFGGREGEERAGVYTQPPNHTQPISGVTPSPPMTLSLSVLLNVLLILYTG